ncbi:MAG TPA: DUF349 domain-containing protein [Balneolaceae bacterium]|nr:DUF349 domain-containing protein [Balneolaceae bacterium]
MTEKKENTSPDSSPIFENEYAYATQDGDIRLKKNSFFEERTVATVDPGSVEGKVQALEQNFEELQTLADAFIADLAKEGASQESTEEQYNELLDKIKNAEAIGDFESLIGEVQSHFKGSGLGESARSSGESAGSPDGPSNSEIGNEGKALTRAAEPVVQKESEVVEGPADAEGTEEEEESGTEEKASDPVVQKESEGVEGPADAEGAEEEEESGTEEDASEPVVQKESEVVEGPVDTEASPSDDKEEEQQELSEVEVYYKELADKAETLSELTDWSYATMEFDNLDHLWGEGPDPEGVEIKQYKNRIDELREELEEKKRAHYEEQKKIREANLARKKELLEELGEIIEKEQWTKTRAVARIKGRWDNIRSVPAEGQEKMENDFLALLTTFDEHKVDRLVKQKQNEEDNLTGKLIILEKMEQLSAEIPEEGVDWKELDKSLNNLARQFRKIGRVPSDRNQDIWARFHKAQDDFHAARFKGDDKYRKNIEKYLSRKKKLIDEAEALVDMDNIAKAARKVNKLHRQWKKAGNLPQKEENELWDRFKAATDAFNEKKSENIDLLREQEDENYTKKKAIIQSAVELKESEEWESAHKEFQQLMERWKGIGPVPRRKSGKIWKEFKGTMDYFYDRRREHFKEIKEERKDNLKEKEEVLEKLKALTEHENPVEAVELAKPLQEEFKKAGYVPIKHKNRMWKEYREICDVIYDRFRAAKSAAQIVGKENVENFSVDDITEIKNKQEHADRVRKEIQSLTSDLIQMKESLSYFKPSGSDSSVLDEVRGRIDKAEQRIRAKEDQLEEIEIEIDKMKRDV